jgi:hypothetical protein
MNANNFSFNEAASVAEWRYDGDSIIINDVQQACFDGGRNFIAVLLKADPKNSLNIFNEMGSLDFVFLPPSGYLFEYLLVDAVHGVRVICSGENERGDILDWYFKIDLPSKELVKQGRAY